MDILPNHKNLRIKGYDYSDAGCYFITVVTEGRRELFGKVQEGRLHLNAAGRMVESCIGSLTERFNGLDISNSVVMPNHVHAILINGNNQNISEVMRQFKAITSRQYRKGVEAKGWAAFDMRLWQRSFYDVIIRNQRMFDFVNNYVTVNPERWIYDKMNEYHAANTDEIYIEINKIR